MLFRERYAICFFKDDRHTSLSLIKMLRIYFNVRYVVIVRINQDDKVILCERNFARYDRYLRPNFTVQKIILSIHLNKFIGSTSMVAFYYDGKTNIPVYNIL